MRLSAGRFLALGALVGLIVVFSTDQIVPATSAYQAQMRIWLAARASGVTAYLLLTLQVLLGLLLSHPENQATWKLSKRLFPWHENLLVFILAFLAAHIVSIVLDPFAGVGIAGAFVPGLSSYRSVPVALGTMALYALLLTGLTARYTRLLPSGTWLTIHRLAAFVFGLAWLHGMLAGSDAATLRPLYLTTGALVVVSAAYRYWIVRRARAIARASAGTTEPRSPLAGSAGPTPPLGAATGVTYTAPPSGDGQRPAAARTPAPAHTLDALTAGTVAAHGVDTHVAGSASPTPAGGDA